MRRVGDDAIERSPPFVVRRRKGRIGAVLVERSAEDDRPPLHRPVLLGERQKPRGSALAERCVVEPRSVRVADCVGVRADAERDPIGDRLTVADGERHHVVGHAGQDEHGGANRSPAHLDLDGVFARDPEARSGRGRDERRVVPRELRDRIAELLQPRAVAEASVVNLRIGEEHDFEERARRGRGREHARDRAPVDRCRDRGLAGGVDHAVYEGPLPERARITLRHRRPVFFDQLPRRRAGHAVQPREDLADGLALRDGPHERLRDRCGPVERPPIAPGLEEVGLRHEPAAQAGRFVFVETYEGRRRHQTNAARHLQVGGRRVRRVAPDNHEGRDVARVDGSHERLEAVAGLAGLDHGRRRKRHRTPGVAEQVVCRVGERVHLWRLPVAGQRQARARVRVEVPGDGLRPGLVEAGGSRRGGAADVGGNRGSADRRQCGHDRRRHASHLARLDGQALVRAHPRRRQPWLDDVEPAHRAFGPAHPALVRPGARPGHRRPRRREKVAIERKDDIGTREIPARLDDPAECELGPGPRRGPRKRLVEMDDDALATEPLDERPKVRAARGLEEHVNPFARRRRRGQLVEQGAPRRRGARAGQFAGPRRVIHREDAGLLEGAERSEARRMQRVAFGLGRPAFVALDDQAGAVAGDRHRGRVPAWYSRRDLRRLPDIRHDELGSSPAASRCTGERGVGAKEHEELAPGEVRGRIDSVGELAHAPSSPMAAGAGLYGRGHRQLPTDLGADLAG